MGVKKVKNKIISIMILITLIAPLLSCYNAVQAYSGEIDPQNYITLPSTIWIENKVGTGTSKGNSVIDLKVLQNDGYYYLYIKTDDENGKYISNEAVTLAQARIHDNGWGLFFYGSSDFKWADFGNIAESGDDDSIAPGKIPHAGSETIKCIGIGIIVVSVGAIFYSKYKRYQGI